LIHFGNGFFSGSAGGEGNETESTGAGGAAFHGEEDVGYGAVGAEYFAKAGFVSGVVQVANIKLDLLTTISTAIITIVSLDIIGTRGRSGIVIVVGIVVVAATVGGTRTGAGAGTAVFGHD